MKRILLLSFSVCLFIYPIFSQPNSHNKIDTNYGNSVIVIDSRPFSVVNRDFEISLNCIINEKYLLIPESSEKDMYLQYRIVPEIGGNQPCENKPRMTTIRYSPKNTHIQVPEIGGPLLIKKP